MRFAIIMSDGFMPRAREILCKLDSERCIYSRKGGAVKNGQVRNIIDTVSEHQRLK